VKQQGPEGIRVRHNLLMVQTLIDKPSDIVLAGACHDLVVEDQGRLRFRERIVAFDSEMVPNSLIYPP
jgi:salicylate 5-hydroxylase small subunit